MLLKVLNEKKYDEDFIINVLRYIIKVKEFLNINNSIERVKQISDNIGGLMATAGQQLIDRGIRQGMQRGMQRGMQQGMQEGMQEGMQQGVQQGLQQGMQQGMQEGMQQGMLQVAARMLAKNVGITTIADFTGIAPEKIKAMNKDPVS